MILIYLLYIPQSKEFFFISMFRKDSLFLRRGDLNNSSENKAQMYDVKRIITLDDHGSTVRIFLHLF